MIELTYKFQNIEELEVFLAKQKAVAVNNSTIQRQAPAVAPTPTESKPVPEQKAAKLKKESTEPTLEDAREALQSVVRKFGMEHATTFIKALGYNRVTAIVKAKFPEFIAACAEECKKEAPAHAPR